ncbi:hypothetical protein PSSHI_14140 [Photobacterium sp. R1]
MMTMYDPVFPTVQQVVTSVKKIFSKLRIWQLKRQCIRSLQEVPEHLRADLGLDQSNEHSSTSANDAHFNDALRWK